MTSESPPPGPSELPIPVTQPASALRVRPSNSPFTNARSPSGHLAPYSPFPRRFSRDYVSRITGSQTSLHEEPSSTNHGAPRVSMAAEPMLRTWSHPTSNIHGNHSSPDMRTHLVSHPLSPPFGSTVRTSIGNSRAGPQSPLQSAHIHFDTDNLQPPWSTSYLRHSASQLSISQTSHLSRNSVSQKSYNSRNSIGRASYREYHGPPARDRTPSPVPGPTIGIGSPFHINPGIGEPDGVAIPQPIIAPPSADDPNHPGEPTGLGLRFFPMSVKGVLRYDDHRKIRDPSELHHYKIEAMSYQYPEIPLPPIVPEGWSAYRHPEGALYYVHNESKTITEVNICDEEIHGDIEYFRNFLISELKTETMELTPPECLRIDEVQLVLEPKLDDLGVMCCYYFVNPPTRSLFWLDEWDGDEIFKDCRGILSPPHKGLAIQEQYWCATLVYDALVTQDLKDEVVDMILHATCDHLTSNTSSCPLSPEELKNHLALVDRIDPEKSDKRGHCAIVIGRIMRIFYRAYFLNYYGEDCARLNFDQSVYGWRYEPSLWMKFFAPVLFMAPVNNVRLLHRLFVDDIVSKEKWNVFVNKLNIQLQETSVLATVLLNANVAFLPKESDVPQLYLSYMSLVASMASIILGLVFMGNIRTEERNTPFRAAKFLHSLRHKKHGLERLAIIYSLPHALLMWGMVLFSGAFMVQWCYPGDTRSWACAGAVTIVVTPLVAWCIWTARDRSDFWWFQADPNPTGFHPEQKEEQGDDELSWGTSFVDFFRRFTPPRAIWKLMTQSVTRETYPM